MSLGRFYNGAHGSFRINVPARLPFFFEPEVTYNQWDFQNTAGVLGRDVINTQVRQQDTKMGGQFGISPNYRSRHAAGRWRTFVTKDEYTNSKEINTRPTCSTPPCSGA